MTGVWRNIHHATVASCSKKMQLCLIKQRQRRMNSTAVFTASVLWRSMQGQHLQIFLQLKWIKVPILKVVIAFWMKLWLVAPFFHSLLDSEKIQNIAACHFLYCCKEITCCNVLYVPQFQKWVKKRGNRSEFHSERNYYLQN